MVNTICFDNLLKFKLTQLNACHRSKSSFFSYGSKLNRIVSVKRIGSFCKYNNKYEQKILKKTKKISYLLTVIILNFDRKS
jgi:hypothetical protein